MCPTSDSEMNGTQMGDTEASGMEFQILMAYAQRRKPELKAQRSPSEERPSPPAPERKKRWPRWKKLVPKCVRPQEEKPLEQLAPARAQSNKPNVGFGNSHCDPAEEKDAPDKIADKLHKIVDSRQTLQKVLLLSDSIESDGIEDEEQYVIQRLVELLKESGDKLNQEIKTDQHLSKCFKEAFSYSLFKKVTDMFLERVCSSAAQEPSRIAFTADITAKLTSVDNHPMNQSMGFGAKYLREHFSTWAQSHGGWEKALNSAEEEEVD
ncbi:apoptosis facilitator Bcl-2-like protein 14 [Polyodon spathula]|uniref:apoptosis facilitator Bcl-2-like protein 14 n=1 Tax=Polyodon spathula TaxID=7913 RepID=UPI001B7E0800|nr:apoptosis facilitator Bcl-2-like protein 14 [Polyodon spathula]XP_041112935.1 apoptosis facilitator Bcl-2-like protein 14 [Polyodon spathula]